MQWLPTLLVLLLGVSIGNGFSFYNPLKIIKDAGKWSNTLEKKVENGVHHMGIEEAQDAASALWKEKPMLLKNFLQNLKTRHIPNVQSETFKWKSCGPKVQPINITSLTVKPQPLVFPGNLQLGFDVNFLKTVANKPDLSAKLSLEFESGQTWVKIPCMGQIGSCDYADICSKTQMITQCPDALVKANIPCKCPFPKGEYKLDMMNIDIDASVFLPGNYRGKVSLSNSEGELACYNVFFVIG